MVKISLFGLPGTGTSSVGKLLASRNNLEFKSSGDMFRNLAQEYKMSLAEFGAHCENNPQIDKELDSSITKFGENTDDFVFDSRLAWFTIPQSFKIKLFCEDKERARRIQEREGGETETIIFDMNAREQSERVRYKQYYGVEDYMNDSHFDLIIDTSSISVEDIVEKIEKEVGLK
ncbi:MAG: (d)CMP kinase [Candidatus Nanoarchaeia archaeon]